MGKLPGISHHNDVTRTSWHLTSPATRPFLRRIVQFNSKKSHLSLVLSVEIPFSHKGQVIRKAFSWYINQPFSLHIHQQTRRRLKCWHPEFSHIYDRASSVHNLIICFGLRTEKCNRIQIVGTGLEIEAVHYIFTVCVFIWNISYFIIDGSTLDWTANI